MTDLIIQQIDFLHTSAKIFLFSGLKLIHSRAEAFVYHHPKIDGFKVPQIVRCRADGAVGFYKSTTYSAPGVTSLALCGLFRMPGLASYLLNLVDEFCHHQNH